MRQVVVVVALVLASSLAACAPPPLPHLPGSPTDNTRQRLSVALMASDGSVVTCELDNEVVISVGIRTWTATSKTYSDAGPCRYADWHSKLLTMTCWVGASLCGGPWQLNTTNAGGPSSGAWSRRPPQSAVLHVDFSATLQPGSNPAFQFPVKVLRATPRIRCNVDSCHFQDGTNP